MAKLNRETIYPEIGKRYACYDDGKIKFSRLYYVTVEKIVPYSSLDKDLKDKYMECVRDHDYLFKQEPVNLLLVKLDNKDADAEYLFPTIDGGWFGIEYMGPGRLDVDGRYSGWLIGEIPNMDENVPYDFADDIEELKRIYQI